ATRFLTAEGFAELASHLRIVVGAPELIVEMAEPSRLLIREASSAGTGSGNQLEKRFSLGHDAIGLATLRFRERRKGEQAEIARNRSARILAIAAAAVSLTLLIAFTAFYSIRSHNERALVFEKTLVSARAVAETSRTAATLLAIKAANI